MFVVVISVQVTCHYNLLQCTMCFRKTDIGCGLGGVGEEKRWHSIYVSLVCSMVQVVVCCLCYVSLRQSDMGNQNCLIYRTKLSIPEKKKKFEEVLLYISGRVQTRTNRSMLMMVEG